MVCVRLAKFLVFADSQIERRIRVRAFKGIIVVTVIFVVAAIIAVVWSDARWTSTRRPENPKEYFLYGSIGAESMPLPVFQVLPNMFPDHFQPPGKDAGDWIDQFGFIRGQENVNFGLPVGFTVTKHLPKSGRRSPVPFVGFTCAVCHEASIRQSEGQGGLLVLGMGNVALDLVPFGDAVKSAVLDERLTVSKIDAAYSAKYHRSLTFVDDLVIYIWLKAARKQIRSEIALRGSPFSGEQLRDPELFVSGPVRIMAPRETVRRLLDQTPNPDGGPSKLPCLYQQEQREWAQFDGSVRDPLTRNSLAAMGVGATAENLRVPDILETMRQSYEYVKTLNGPRFLDVLHGPDAIIDTTRANRGREVYRRYCGDCHGWPGSSPGEWVRGERLGEVIPVEEIGTDSARVNFRFYDNLPVCFHASTILAQWQRGDPC
jgi:hypothetical protein